MNCRYPPPKSQSYPFEDIFLVVSTKTYQNHISQLGSSSQVHTGLGEKKTDMKQPTRHGRLNLSLTIEFVGDVLLIRFY